MENEVFSIENEDSSIESEGSSIGNEDSSGSGALWMGPLYHNCYPILNGLQLLKQYWNNTEMILYKQLRGAMLKNTAAVYGLVVSFIERKWQFYTEIYSFVYT